jgi:hypothetical protein
MLILIRVLEHQFMEMGFIFSYFSWLQFSITYTYQLDTKSSRVIIFFHLKSESPISFSPYYIVEALAERAIQRLALGACRRVMMETDFI